MSKSFLACVHECVSERESKGFRKGLDIRISYKRFVKQSDVKKYLAVVMLGLDFC